MDIRGKNKHPNRRENDRRAKCHVMGKICSRNRVGGGRGGNLKDEGYSALSRDRIKDRELVKGGLKKEI